MGFNSGFKGLIGASGWLIHLNYLKSSEEVWKAIAKTKKVAYIK